MSEAPACAMADCSLRGKDSRMGMAKVIAGDRVGEIVCVMVQFTDGFCICDPGGDLPLEILRIEDLRLFVSVESVQIDSDGRLVIELTKGG